MPRYFFRLRNDRAVTPDLVGQELPDTEAAKAEAAKLAADIGFSSTPEGESPHYYWVEVVDDDEGPVARLPVSRTMREPNRFV